MGKKNLISIFLVFALFINTISGATVNAKETKGELVQYKYENKAKNFQKMKRDMQKQSKANKDYEKISKKMEIELDGKEEISYQNYYSGSYINDENELVVCVTDELYVEEIEKNYGVKTKVVDNSYNKLCDVQNKMRAIYEKLYSEEDTNTVILNFLNTISGFGINEETNKIEVNISDINETQINMFREIFGESECIDLIKAEGKVEECATYRPGRALYVITGKKGTTIYASQVSMGFRAKSGTTKGFVTCGHTIKDAINSYIYKSTNYTTNNIIGIRVMYQYSGSVDASFYKMYNSSDNIGTKTEYSKHDIAENVYMTSVAKGATVYMNGSNTESGTAKITNTNYTITYGGRTFTNLTKTSVFCDSGDSGGIVYTYFDNEYIPCGIVKGVGREWFSSFSVYVKASEIVNSFRITPY